MQKHIIVDPDKCTGCEICEFVCSQVHTGAFNPYFSRIKAIRIEPIINFALGCQFCKDPPCVAVCPWKALEKDEVISGMFDKEFLKKYINAKKQEWDSYRIQVTEVRNLRRLMNKF